MVEIKKTVKSALILLLIFLLSICALSSVIFAGDIEDFLKWNESDQNDKLSRTSTRATWTNMIKNETCYFYKSFHTYSSFTHKFDFQVSSIDVNDDSGSSSVDSVILYLNVRATVKQFIEGRADLWNGSEYVPVLYFGVGSVGTGWSWKWSENLIGYNLDTMAKVNDAKFRIYFTGEAPPAKMRITYVYLKVMASGQTYYCHITGRLPEAQGWSEIGEFPPFLDINDGDDNCIEAGVVGQFSAGYIFEDLPIGLVSLWMVSEAPTTFFNTTTKFLHVGIYDVGSSTTIFRIYAGGSASTQNISTTTFNVSTTYYIKVIRAGLTSFRCEIYSDIERTSLIEKLTGNLNSPNQIHYNYVQTTTSIATILEGSDQSDGYVENMDIGAFYTKPFVDRYTMVGIGLAGLILMVWCPTWVALKFRKKGLEVETIETFGYAMLLFFVGFGFFIIWLYS